MDKTTPMQSKPLVDVTCKLGTKGCFEDGRCHAIGNCENKIVTNADRIRAMSDEDLLKVFNVAMNACPPDTEEDRWCDADDDCERCWLEWLKQPVKEGCLMELKPCYGKCERCVWLYNGGCSEWNGTSRVGEEETA